MKVIGETEDGFILDARASEIANLVGFYSQFDIEHIKLGTEIDVHRMYQQLYKLSSMRKEMTGIADKLVHYSLALRPLMPVDIKCPTKGG